MLRERLFSPDVIELDKALRSALQKGRIDNPKLQKEAKRRNRGTDSKGRQVIILPKLTDEEYRRVTKEGGKLVGTTIDITTRELIAKGTPNLGYVDPRLLDSSSVATEFVYDPENLNLIVAGSRGLYHQSRIQATQGEDVRFQDQFGPGVGVPRLRHPELTQLDAQFMRENNGFPLIADRQRSRPLFIDLAEKAGAGHFFVIGRVHPDYQLYGNDWDDDYPAFSVGAPAVAVPVWRVEA